MGIPSGLFSSDFPSKTLFTPHLFPIGATRSARHILLDLITEHVGENKELVLEEAVGLS
jgi:hypothetical protein